MLEELSVILNRARGVKRSGDGYVAFCPAHEDRKERSLSLRERDGKLLLHCFTGCSFEAILAAFGTTGFTSPSTTKTSESQSSRRAEALVRRYEVRERDGRLVAVHVRRDYGDHKEFWWEREGKKGLQGLDVSALPLYGIDRLPRPRDPFAFMDIVLNSTEIIVTEGEKACESLWSRGYASVSTYGASAIPTTQRLAELLGYVVYLWPDNDDIGRKHMNEVARSYPNSDVPLVIAWPDAPPHGDAADYKGDVGELMGNAVPWERQEEPEGESLARFF